MQDYHNIVAWKRSYQFVKKVYRHTALFPKHEIFGITSQLRRAATSISANIVEGRGKPSDKDFLRFLYISKGSLNECEFFLELSSDLNYLTKESFSELTVELKKTAYLLNKLISSIKQFSEHPKLS